MDAQQAPKARTAIGLDLTAAAILLFAAYLLAGSGSYHRYSYYENLRVVVCTAWILADVRFWFFKWYPVSVLGAVIAWLFNPIFPVTMRKWEWQPYDHWTMLLSVAAAVTLIVLGTRQFPRSHSLTGTKTPSE
jgi:hypothetical protein